MYGLNLKSTPFVGSKTLIQRALSILRRPGIEAHVYLPGIGTISGLQAANYLLSDGSTGNTTVDGVTGLVLDAMGSETQLFNAVGVTTAGPSLTGLNASLNTTAGKTYKVTYTVTALVGQLSSVAGGTSGLAQAINWTGTYSEMLVAVTTGFTNCGLITRGIGVTSVTGSVTVTEVTGIHASQPTTAAKPILRQTAGKYSWAFDGNDSLSLGSVPFLQSDDFSVHIAARLDTAGAQRTLYSHSNASNHQIAWVYFNATGNLVWTSWDGTTSVNITSPSTYLGVPIVIRARKIGNTGTLWINGVQVATASLAAVGSPALTSANIGSFNTAALQHIGTMGFTLPLKGTQTDAEGLTIDRLVASNFPNSPSF